MGSFAGMLTGISGALEQEHKDQFETELAKRRTLTEMFLKDAHDPNNKPWHQQDATRRLGMLIQTPYNKKLPSDVENLKTYGQRPQQLEQPRQQGGSPGNYTAPPPSPSSAPGDKPAGVLQGGANGVPAPNFMGPVQPAEPPPPPVSLPQSSIPIGAPPAPPTYGGPMVESGHLSAADHNNALANELATRHDAAIKQTDAIFKQETANLIQRGKDLGLQGAELKNYVLLGGKGLLGANPTPVNVMMGDGSTQVVTKHLDPGTRTVHFFDRSGADVTENVQREIGLAVMPKTEVLKGLGGLPFAIKRSDGTVIPLNDSRLTDEEKTLLSEGRKGVTRSTSSSSTTDESGNTSTRRTTTQTPQGAAAPPPPPGSSSSSKPAASSEGGGKLAFEAKKFAMRDAAAAAKTARPMVNLLDTAEKYTTAVNSGKQTPDSARDLGLIVQAVRAMNPGTVRIPNTEIMMEAGRGTYGQQFERWVKGRLVNGTLPTQFRNELMGVIRDETTQVAKDAAGAWQSSMPKQALPPHLQRFGGAPGATGPVGATGATGGKKQAYQVGAVWYDAATHQPIPK